MLKFMLALLRRDFLVGMRKWAAWAEPFIFFTIALVLFPLAGSPESGMLKEAAPAVVWISVVFANFLVLERLLKPDFDDGSLEQLLIAPYPLGMILLFKVLAHWLIFSLPLVILAPAYSLLLFLPPDAVGAMILGLAAGTLTMNLVGSIGAALIVTLRGNNLLSGLLVVPFYIPVLVFGAHATYALSLGLDASGQFAMLSAMLLLALILAPFAAAAALRASID